MSPRRIALVFGVLTVLFAASAALELSLGSMAIPVSDIPTDVWMFITGHRSSNAVVMGAVRLPRFLTATLVGAGLASTGAALQALFRNPLADPAIIGVSSGSSLGAVVTIQLGISSINEWITPGAAFISGLVTVYFIYRLATIKGTTTIHSLLLSGVALASMCSAVVALLLSLVQLQTLQAILFWLIGGLDGSTWTQLSTLSVCVAAGFTVFLWKANALDLMSLGEEQALGVGVPIQFTKQVVLVTSAFVVGACVSITGVIAFVGLIVPHLMRLWVGASHRYLLPASAIGGAILVLLSDVIARTMFLPAELNAGIVSSCLGAPFFLFLLKRTGATTRVGRRRIRRGGMA